MNPETVTFPSDGHTLEALIFRPEGTGPHPVVVMAGGWCYVKELAQPKHAAVFARHGLASVVFDYRTFGGSTGTPRQHIDPWAQWDDYRNAITYVEHDATLDADRVGIWGISYSGGHVLAVGALDPRVRCVTSVVPVIDGYENLRLAHGTMSFRRLTEAVLAARRERYTTGAHSYLPHASRHPDEVLPTWPFPASEPMFERLRRTQAPAYENRATTASTEMLLAYNVMPYAARLVGTPTLMIVAEGDDHTHWDLALDAYNAIPTPDKRLYVVPESTHHTIYEQDAQLELAADTAGAWFATQLTRDRAV